MAASTQQDPDAFVFNNWHELLPLSPVDRYLFPLLDGSRDRETLITALLDVVAQNVIRIDRDDGREPDDEDIRDVIGQWVDALPERLAEMKLMSVCDHAAASISLRANGC